MAFDFGCEETPETSNREESKQVRNDESVAKWMLRRLTNPNECRMLTIPRIDFSLVSRVSFTHSASAIIILQGNGAISLSKWGICEGNATGKVTTRIFPRLMRPEGGVMMNDTSFANFPDTIPCMDISRTGRYVISSVGGDVTLYDTFTFKVIMKFVTRPRRAPTCLSIDTSDHSSVAIGMDDSTIDIVSLKNGEVLKSLAAHVKRVTGLAFSEKLLVSSGADTQVCSWKTDTWEKLTSFFVFHDDTLGGDTSVHIHNDAVHVLVVHERQLGVYSAISGTRVSKCVARAPLSCAAYSKECDIVVAGSYTGEIAVFDGRLRLRYQVSPSTYMSGGPVFPRCVAIHPSVDTQFVIGLSDGSVRVIEPLVQASSGLGMSVHGDCITKFMDLKTKQAYRFIIYKIEERQYKVFVDSIGELEETYEEFAASLPDDECRYAVFDYDCMTEENTTSSRILFVVWSPEIASSSNKMMYGCSKDRFKMVLDGIQSEVHATGPTGLSRDIFKSCT